MPALAIPRTSQLAQELGESKMKRGYMAIYDGGTLHIKDNPPRKWLLDYFGRKHAEKIYIDTKEGKPRHVGYIIAGNWITVYAVHDWKKAA